MPEPQPRIALLIDADNAPAEMIDEILTELSTFGVIDIRRAYGNWTKHSLSGWQRKLLDFALRPMQQFDYSKHKNATDMAMTVDAMELLYTERPDAFGIVSSDADFTPLVMHLRSKGAAVYGFGMAQTRQPTAMARTPRMRQARRRCRPWLHQPPPRPSRPTAPARNARRPRPSRHLPPCRFPSRSAPACAFLRRSCARTRAC